MGDRLAKYTPEITHGGVLLDRKLLYELPPKSHFDIGEPSKRLARIVYQSFGLDGAHIVETYLAREQQMSVFYRGEVADGLVTRRFGPITQSEHSAYEQAVQDSLKEQARKERVVLKKRRKVTKKINEHRMLAEALATAAGVTLDIDRLVPMPQYVGVASRKGVLIDDDDTDGSSVKIAQALIVNTTTDLTLSHTSLMTNNDQDGVISRMGASYQLVHPVTFRLSEEGRLMQAEARRIATMYGVGICNTLSAHPVQNDEGDRHYRMPVIRYPDGAFFYGVAGPANNWDVFENVVSAGEHFSMKLANRGVRVCR